MAIIVPSKKLYDVQSPQILKNAVKGITIDLLNDKLVNSQNNNNAFDYVIVENDVTETIKLAPQSKKYENFGNLDVGQNLQQIRFFAGFGEGWVRSNGNIKIDRNGNDYYIDSVNPTLDLEIAVYKGTTEGSAIFEKKVNFNSSNISFDTIYNVEMVDGGEIIARQNSFIFSNQNYQNITNISNENTEAYTNISTNIRIIEKKGDTKVIFKPQIEVNFEAYNNAIFNPHANATYTLLGFSNSLTCNTDKDNIYIEFSYIQRLIIDYFADSFFAPTADERAKYVDCVRYDFEVTKATIVLNEVVRKIDRTEKSKVITTSTTNGSTISVSRNQFIKDKMTYNDVDGIIQLWANVADAYRNGKAYVRFVSSLGDFYDENGEKVISTDSSDKMMLDIYDEIVVMKSGKHNADESIMFDSNGKSKIYSVVSVKPYFDGALWQEVVAIDTGKTVDLRKTTYTTIGNKAGGLTYKITSNQIRTEENSAGGITYIIGA